MQVCVGGGGGGALAGLPVGLLCELLLSGALFVQHDAAVLVSTRGTIACFKAFQTILRGNCPRPLAM